MTRLTPLLLPVSLFAFLAALAQGWDGLAAWPESAFFRFLPYVILAVALVLGSLFAQIRVSLVALLAVLLYFMARYSAWGRADAARADAVVLAGSVGAPVFGLVFYGLNERGLWTRAGLARVLLVFATPVFAVLLGGLRAGEAGLVPEAVLSPRGGLLGLPGAGWAALALCTPLFFVRKRHESPLLGPSLWLSILCVLAGLSFRAPHWGTDRSEAVLTLFMAGAGVLLAWTVLESVWRNAFVDELTELPGRRSLKQHFMRLGPRYTLAIVDVDRFKRINDRYGHDAGDQVLRYIAAALRRSNAGRAYRYGGEEFVIVAETDDTAAVRAAVETLREHIASRRFTIRGRGRPRRKPESPRPPEKPRQATTVTVSIGVASRGARYETPREVLEAADRALYRAKAAGRNRVAAAKG
ncbi:MAG: GGDEF domain-containing protein [Lentisphaerae bacterium]|nr:GGDEF domain-containing protein [Lentisphaerota bacterium]